MPRLALALTVLLTLAGRLSAEPTDASQQNSQAGSATPITNGLLAFYDFTEIEGNWVRDRSGSRGPIDLKIQKPNRVQQGEGFLKLQGGHLRSPKPPRRIVAAIQRSRALTIEAWIQPENDKQLGPARIVSLSKDSSNRNVTLGQEANRYDVRLRSTKTNRNGLPSLSGSTNVTHSQITQVVYTRNPKGLAQLWIDGELDSEHTVGGNFDNWDAKSMLALGDEVTGGRTWKGKIYRVGIYRRALTQNEIRQSFTAGPHATVPETTPQPAVDPRANHFELTVAPILANRCLECHDAFVREGGLDLSTQTTALRGGDSGPAIVPKDAAASLLWQSVENDDMPHNRPPLSAREKQELRKWIGDGAVFSLTTIDPAIYVHGGQADVPWIRRLTVPEYVETVRDLFGLDVASDAQELLPPDVRADGFRNTAYNLNVDLKHIQAYGKLASRITERIDVEAFCKQFVKRLEFGDKPMKNLIQTMGTRIFRGPLEDREVTSLHGIYTTLAATNDGDTREVIRLLIEAMLQSPRFLYRIEQQTGNQSVEPVADYELASRLSYMIWGAPPDDRLFRAAEAGELYELEEIQRQVRRMLEDSRAAKQAIRFFADWLRLDRLANLQPNATKFPDWNPALAEDMREETLAFVREVIWDQDRPMQDLLNAQVTFATPRLAKHYGLPASAANVAESRDRLVRYDLQTVPSRGGLLTQGSLLTVGGDEASMVTRGLFVMHELLRGVVKDPPPCVDTTPVPSKPGLSQRTIAEQRIGNATCGGCHGRFEPLAFGLERFDGLGKYHERDEHGNALREDGEMIFPGEAQKTRYATSAELMNRIARSERVQESLTWKLTQFALGRPLSAADAKTVQAIHKTAKQQGGTYRSTLTAIATSDLVTTIRTTPNDSSGPLRRSNSSRP